jgi:two-component sensor histidine kinase
MVEKINQDSKRQLALLTLLLAFIVASITHLVHWFQVDPFGFNRIGSGIIAIVSFVYWVLLYKKQTRTESSMLQYLVIIRLSMISATVRSIFIVHNFDGLMLVEFYPPFTSISFLWMTLVVIFVPYQKLISFFIWGCMPLSIPITLYLVLHPNELKTVRGTELFIANSLLTVMYVFISLFYASLQQKFKQLTEERLNYYSKIITTQNIRQAAIKEIFTSLHNGPLQSLALLNREIKSERLSLAQITDRLDELNTEIRRTSQSLTETIADLSDESNPSIRKETLQLGSVTIDLYRPLHSILHEIYGATITRPLPYFKSIKVKIRSFDSIDSGYLSLEQKREIGFWLEEALCNVGKYAKEVTRLVVTGCYCNGRYILTVEDNGQGLQQNQRSGQGTAQSLALASKLGGEFIRESVTTGGVKCQLAWQLDSEILSES